MNTRPGLPAMSADPRQSGSVPAIANAPSRDLAKKKRKKRFVKSASRSWPATEGRHPHRGDNTVPTISNNLIASPRTQGDLPNLSTETVTRARALRSRRLENHGRPVAGKSRSCASRSGRDRAHASGGKSPSHKTGGPCGPSTTDTGLPSEGCCAAPRAESRSTISTDDRVARGNGQASTGRRGPRIFVIHRRGGLGRAQSRQTRPTPVGPRIFLRPALTETDPVYRMPRSVHRSASPRRRQPVSNAWGKRQTTPPRFRQRENVVVRQKIEAHRPRRVRLFFYLRCADTSNVKKAPSWHPVGFPRERQALACRTGQEARTSPIALMSFATGGLRTRNQAKGALRDAGLVAVAVSAFTLPVLALLYPRRRPLNK